MVNVLRDTSAATDRRYTKRHRVPEQRFVAVNSETQETLGEILDISAQGLAFIYRVDNSTALESNLLDILSDAGHHQVGPLPYRNMNDFDYLLGYTFDARLMRRRGVKFEKLSENQISDIEQFIRDSIKK